MRGEAEIEKILGKINEESVLGKEKSVRGIEESVLGIEGGQGKLVFEPQTRFLKSFLPKLGYFLSKINENPAFHTHFIDFGGVGANETG